VMTFLEETQNPVLFQNHTATLKRNVMLNISQIKQKLANRLVTIFLPFMIFVDVDTDLTFLDGMPAPFEDEKLENDENLCRTSRHV